MDVLFDVLVAQGLEIVKLCHIFFRLYRSRYKYTAFFLYRKRYFEKSEKNRRFVFYYKEYYECNTDRSSDSFSGHGAWIGFRLFHEEGYVADASSGEHSNLSTIGFAIGFVLMMVLDVVMG